MGRHSSSSFIKLSLQCACSCHIDMIQTADRLFIDRSCTVGWNLKCSHCALDVAGWEFLSLLLSHHTFRTVRSQTLHRRLMNACARSASLDCLLIFTTHISQSDPEPCTAGWWMHVQEAPQSIASCNLHLTRNYHVPHSSPVHCTTKYVCKKWMRHKGSSLN